MAVRRGGEAVRHGGAAWRRGGEAWRRGGEAWQGSLAGAGRTSPTFDLQDAQRMVSHALEARR